MISVQEADSFIAQHVSLLPTESCPVREAAGRILREDILADRDLPPFHRVMMDGIACSFSAWAKGQRTFRMEGAGRPGEPARVLESPDSGCIEIMTGAVLPENCDCIVPYEDLDISNGSATIREDISTASMQYVHQQGSDQHAGDLLLKRGTRLFSPQIAVAASIGNPDILVSCYPSAAVISNGDELVDLGQAVEPYQIRPVNNYSLAAALQNIGLPEARIFHMHDDPTEMRACLEKTLKKFDVIILSGGVSMGRFDHVPTVLNDLGAKMVFHKIRQRPGKPFWFGIMAEEKPVFALPGNPVSTMICFHRYVLPWLERSLGAAPPESEFAELTEEIIFEPQLTFFPPATIAPAGDGRLQATPVRYNNSGHFTAMGNSNGFLELNEQQTSFPAGTTVPFHRWRC